MIYLFLSLHFDIKVQCIMKDIGITVIPHKQERTQHASSQQYKKRIQYKESDDSILDIDQVRKLVEVSNFCYQDVK